MEHAMNRRQIRGGTGWSLLFGLLAAGALAEPVQLKIMTLNVLTDGGSPSGNADAWIYTGGPDRRDRAIQVIVDAAPDILALQEAEPNQVADLTNAPLLTAYGHYGAGRDDGASAGQHENIFYLTNRFTRTDQGVFWLSFTPDTPNSLYPGAAQVRIAVWAKLLDAESEQTYFVLSTHWDHVNSAAREYSAQLIRDRIALLASNLPVIVCGDLNSIPDERAYSVVMGEEDLAGLQLLDSLREVSPAEQNDELTRHGFAGGAIGNHIDYCLFSSSFEVIESEVVRSSYDGGRYPSDHYPVSAVVIVAPPAADPPPPGEAVAIVQTGFENEVGEWGYSTSVSSANAQVQEVTTPVHTGTQALGFTLSADTRETLTVQFDETDTRLFDNLCVSFWWTAPDPSDFSDSDYVKVTAHYRLGADDYRTTLLNASEGRLDGNTSWAKISACLPAGAEAVSLSITSSLNEAVAEHVYFDDVIVEGVLKNPVIFDASFEDSTLSFSWGSVSGFVYRILYSDDLKTWQEVTPGSPITALTASAMFSIPVPPEIDRRHYAITFEPE
jgi:endonuclease/exonuclease/phosphatase family metal-dependent hydrolase